METTNFADFEPSAASPQPPATPPRPPPRDLNPFGEPESPPHAAPDNSVVNLGDTLDNAPPRPTTPPPPPPIPPKDAAIDGMDSGSSAGPWAPSGAAEGGPHASPPSPPMSPLPPQSSPPPPPAVGRGGGGVGEALDESASSLLTGRRKALDDTRLFEQRRNHHFGEKFDGDSLYWKCFVELIRRSQANNRRVINYATQKLSASHAYAKALYAIRDRVDGLEVGTTETHCEKVRRKMGAKTWPPAPLPPRDVPKEGGSSGASEPGATQRPASALDSLFVMEEHTAMRTLDMVDEAKVTVIDKRLKAMVKSLDDRFSEMVGQGTACLRIMHAAEANSAKAYTRYTETVMESLKREEATSANAALASRDVVSSDVWLSDMNYRVAVTQQARVWKGVSGKLGDLFAKMKDVEVERRQAIQGGLSALMQLQDALWRDLPILKDPVLQSLDRINVDRQLLDQEVRQQMRRGAVRLLATRQEDGGSSGAGGSGAGGGASSGSAADALGEIEVPDASRTLAPDFLKSLESPLDSPLIARSTMLERKDKMMLGSRWFLVLAILTHDSYLLLFDVPKGGAAHKKQLNARTAEAFSELVPKPEVDAMAVELGKHLKDGKGLDSSGLPVPPSIAIDLSACQVKFKPDGKNDATFEITEIKPARGMKGVFKDYDETKFTLRGRSQEAMVDWVCEIKEMGRAGMQAVASRGKGGKGK